MTFSKVFGIITSVMIAIILGWGLFVEVARYTACHAQVEDMGFTPNYDPITLKCVAKP